MDSVLIASKGITRKEGQDLDEIIYIHSTVRLWQHGRNSYQLTVTQSGHYFPELNLPFESLEIAQQAFDQIKGGK